MTSHEYILTMVCSPNFGDSCLVASDAKEILLKCPKTPSKDYKAQLKFIRQCEEAYTLLSDADAFQAIPLELVDDLVDKLPDSLAREWQTEHL